MLCEPPAQRCTESERAGNRGEDGRAQNQSRPEGKENVPWPAQLWERNYESDSHEQTETHRASQENGERSEGLIDCEFQSCHPWCSVPPKIPLHDDLSWASAPQSRHLGVFIRCS